MVVHWDYEGRRTVDNCGSVIQYPPMSLKHVTLGEGAPEVINTVVEIPRGSHNKFEYDETLNAIRLDRVLHSSVVYPTEYGFVPETRAEDGDHLDVLVLTTDPLFPGCVLSVRPIGVADMEDDKGKDWKVLAVAEHDPRYAEIKELSDIPTHRLNEIQNFFEVYKQLENKTVTFNGWLDRQKAYEVINQCNQAHLDDEVFGI